METFIGLARDFIAAGLGLAILFGAGFTDEQEAGILLVGSTGLAMATWGYKAWKASKKEG